MRVRKNIFTILRHYPQIHMTEQSTKKDQKLKEEARRGKSGPWIITITLIAALAVSYYQWNRHTRQTKAYAAVMANYTPPNNGLELKDLANTDLAAAVKEFEAENYEDSYNMLKKIKPKTDDVYWYLGHIALLKGNVYEVKNHSKKIQDPALQKELLKYVNPIISE